MQASQPAFVIRPNVTKICMINVIKVAAAAIIIIAVATYAKNLVDFAVISELFEDPSQELPAPQQVLMNFLLGTFVAAAAAFGLSYMSASKKQYGFYPDRIEMYDNFLIFNISQKTIPLANVVSVNAEQEGEAKLFGMGKIVLQLTAMKDQKAELEDIDKPEYYIPYIQNLINQLRARFDTEYKFNATVDRTLSGL